MKHHELCEQPYFVRWWDHGYELCKLYPIHVYSNSNMDKHMYNTVSTMLPGQNVSLLLGWCQHLCNFLLMYVMCGDQFNLQSMMTPRNLVVVTSIILFPSINIPFMNRGTHFGVKSMKFVLSMFRVLSKFVSFNPCISACVITWLCTDSPLPDCYIVLLITPKHPTHSNTGTVTVAELSCTHSFPHNDPMHGFGDECVQYYSQPQSCTHV